MALSLSMYAVLQVTGPALHAEPTTLHGAPSVSAAMSPGVHSHSSPGSTLESCSPFDVRLTTTYIVWSACDRLMRQEAVVTLLIIAHLHRPGHVPGASGGFNRGAPPPRDGDWACPECGVNNFAYRGECFRCQAERYARLAIRLLPDVCLVPGMHQQVAHSTVGSFANLLCTTD